MLESWISKSMVALSCSEFQSIHTHVWYRELSLVTLDYGCSTGPNILCSFIAWSMLRGKNQASYFHQFEFNNEQLAEQYFLWPWFTSFDIAVSLSGNHYFLFLSCSYFLFLSCSYFIHHQSCSWWHLWFQMGTGSLWTSMFHSCWGCRSILWRCSSLQVHITYAWPASWWCKAMCDCVQCTYLVWIL